MFTQTFNRTVCIALTAALLACVLCLFPASAATSSSTVNFTLSSDKASAASVDVKLTFNMKAGQKALLEPFDQKAQQGAAGAAPDISMPASTDPSFAIQQVAGVSNQWTVTASSDGLAQVSYKVTVATKSGAPAVTPGAPGSASAPRAHASSDLKAFMASDLLLAPQNESGGYLTESYGVKVQAASGETSLAPWKSPSAGSFSVDSTSTLLSNFIAWGKIKTVVKRSAKPAITIGFTSEYDSAKDSTRSAYAGNLIKIYDELVRVMGPRPEQTYATVLVTGSAARGARGPSSESLRDSFLLFHGGSELSGLAAAAAGRGWFELWNRWSLVPRQGGDSAWFQQGMPWFYGYRIAGKLGLSDANTAYAGFSAVYAAYLAGPGATTTSLSAAEAGGEASLLATKGAAVCADISVKLATEGTGAAKDIEWLLGQMVKEFNAFKGQKYSLPNISEILEKGTNSSWDAFFHDTVSGTAVILASSFSTTDQFGTGATMGGAKKLTGQGSGKNWIYLIVAILVIFSIPLIFSTYIRRSIRLDLSMPKILPDDEDAEEDQDES